MTPYERCKDLGHDTTRSSFDGIQVVEQCETCRLKWLMPSTFSVPGERPITIYNSISFKGAK